nr:MAG TPA: hypothetical protein [Caudoviricetes sp.]
MGKEFLTIQLDDVDYWDDIKEEFVSYPGKEVTFRYTLKNLDKWETKYEKRFIDNDKNIKKEELLDFICIICDEDLDVTRLSQENMEEILRYLKHTPSATELPKSRNSGTGFSRKKIFTAEIIYGYMALNHIPFSWEDRNLNKLIMLLNCVGSLQEPPKKMTKAEAMEEHRQVVLENRRKQEELSRKHGK